MEGEKIDYKEIIKQFEEDVNCYDATGSAIAEFFAGRHVFVTGGTGFLGKLTVEKLLRCCPDVAGIFLLARPKKGKDVHTRVDEIFNDVVFERLSNKHPKFRYKIVPVTGDVGQPGLGLRIEDRKAITEKVSVIFHIAATVRFDEKLTIANDINVKGTLEALNLARECGRLASFVHVSTAYAHCPRKEIGEVFYDTPMSPESLDQICRNLPQEILQRITPDLIGEWPNTYAYTKAIAEEIVRKHGKSLPVCVFRPSIVVSTYKEPYKGWIDNIYGPTGVFLGGGMGLLRAMMAKEDVVADVIPADLVINGLVAAAYRTGTAPTAKPDDIPIYNFTSSQQPITWGDYMNWSKRYGLEFGPTRSIWYYNLVLFSNRLLYAVYAFFVHTVPALAIDLVTVLLLKKPQFLKIYKKVHKFNDVIAYFATRSWTFRDENVQTLYESLPAADRRIFDFNVKHLDWIEYMKVYGLGVRNFVAKDPVSTVDDGRKRYKKLKIIHYTVVTILFVMLLKFTMWITNSLVDLMV